MSEHVIWFSEPACCEVANAGGKGASLASMTQQGLPVPGGFAVPADVLATCVDAEKLRAFARARDHYAAIKLVEETAIVPRAVLDAYAELGGGMVAVRSSASAEDSEAASYAGQQETYLEVSGAEDVRRRVIDCWASFFSERALFYRGEKGSLDDLRMAVVIQNMVDADKAGVVFSNHPVTRRKDRMMIEAVHGLGEQVVSGEVTPDQYIVDRKGREKKSQIPHGGVLTQAELTRISELAVQLETHYGKPQDVEWAIFQNDVFLLQSRPITA
ncbi:PEP/pyruvate-binding domain-containing protein [uncultured Tateyamaria sp.]|uniref:PEP/pyruvate-binding domain-containing protein n=1 Tax=uncultured Tateyamaria sp. TaxID=455651 RepID=UPI002612D828|nr:PEP/pyruvate-binding domain-containing protein [uncultured Tateyamaria sp.]